MPNPQTRAIEAMERLQELVDDGVITADDGQLVMEALRLQQQQIQDIREIKNGYYDGMLAWRRLAEDGIPIEESLRRRTPASPMKIAFH